MLPIIFRGHTDAGFFVHALGHNEERKLFHMLPGNQRTPDGRYVCIVPVRDFWRMSRNLTQKKEVWHYSNGIDREIIDDTKSGRAVIVFDLTNEGPGYSPPIFDELYCWIEANTLPPGRVIWLAQNRAIAEIAKTITGGRSELLRFEYYDFFIKMIAKDFAPGARGSDRIYNNDPEEAISRLLNQELKDRLLLCLNATSRLNRILTVAALFHYDLIERSQVSFGGFQYVKDGATIESALSFISCNPHLMYLRADIERLITLNAMVVDSFGEKGNALVSKIDPRSYERTYFSLVTESDFSNGAIDRITEKTAKAFCMGHPLVIIGNPKSISFMTELGFQDWDSIIDRDYEDVTDPAERFAAAFREVLRQAKSLQLDPVAWLSRTREVGTWNIRHAFRGGMLSRYIARYDLPIVHKLSALIGI
jgi:hypothetical protein